MAGHSDTDSSGGRTKRTFWFIRRNGRNEMNGKLHYWRWLRFVMPMHVLYVGHGLPSWSILRSVISIRRLMAYEKYSRIIPRYMA